MKILAQAGYGKSTYIEDGLTDGSLKGAILSPRDEEPASLRSNAKVLSERPGVEFLAIDPQFYAFTITDGRLRYLDRYPYNPGFLSRKSFSDTVKLRAMSIDALKFQRSLPVTHVISPGIHLFDLRDSYSQIFITMAQESIKYNKETKPDKRPLLLSLTLAESALLSPDAVEEFLDVISAWNYEGFYICVEPNNSTYPSTLAAASLANLLYIVYVLTALNSYQVVIGFADFSSLLFSAAGAEYAATGWYNSLKQFSLTRFTPKRPGGARARPRYASRPLLTSILIEPELAEIVDLGLTQYAISGLPFDDALLRDVSSSNWPASVAFRAHAAVLSHLDDNLPNGSAKEKLEWARREIERSFSSRQLLTTKGVSFETRFGFLRTWREAIEQLLDRI